VQKGECDFNSDAAKTLRAWVRGIDLKTKDHCCHFMPYAATGSDDGRRNMSPYITSPYSNTGNVSDSNCSLLRVDNVVGTMDFSIASNMTKNSKIKNFFHSSNVDNDTNNIIPALLTHSSKVCDFDALFNMAPVLNVKFFLGLLFTEVELRQLSEGIFLPIADDRPSTGAFQRLEKQAVRGETDIPREPGSPWTAYGVHIVVIIVLASFLGNDTPNTCECNTVVASKITSILMQHAPAAMLHPSGKDMLVRGFTGKSVVACKLQVPARTDHVKASFFHRHVNDTSLMNAHPSMSVLNSPLQPFMFEDIIHVQWTEFLRKCHLGLVQQWDKGCVLNGTEVAGRGVHANKDIGTIMLSDMYRSLDPSKIPCNDTLLYGIHYPIIGTGTRHTIVELFQNNSQIKNAKYTMVVGWVCIRDAEHAEIHIFRTQPEEVFQLPVHTSDDEDDGENNNDDGILFDKGCPEEHFTLKTKDVFATLRYKSLLVQPLVARPGATLYCQENKRYGTLHFDSTTGQCYNPLDGRYTMRVCDEGSVEASVDSIDNNMIKLTPLEIEPMLLCVPTTVFVDTRAFVIDGVPDPRLPVGADSNTYLKCNLWYPHSEVEYTQDYVYLLAHKSGVNSSNYSMMECNVMFLVHPEALDSEWDVITSIRPID
jgi:hypothetical protein